YYVQAQLAVAATSPAVGSTLTAPVTDIVVQFNKDFDPNTVSASDFLTSQGSIVSAVPLTSRAVDLTLSGVTQDGLLTLTLPAGAMLDAVGVANQAFSGTYIAAPPFQPVSVSGSIYLDANGNGTREGTEGPLAGWTVNLLDAGNNIVGTATSDSTGN